MGINIVKIFWLDGLVWKTNTVSLTKTFVVSEYIFSRVEWEFNVKKNENINYFIWFGN